MKGLIFPKKSYDFLSQFFVWNDKDVVPTKSQGYLFWNGLTSKMDKNIVKIWINLTLKRGTSYIFLKSLITSKSLKRISRIFLRYEKGL
jgi:hypothetical protein